MRVKLDGKIKEFRAVWFENGRVKIIDQRALPERFEIYTAENCEEVCRAIKDMVVRGAPAIGATAVYAMAQAWIQRRDLKETAELLRKTRPTAFDLFHGIEIMLSLKEKDVVEAGERYVDSLVENCRKIGIEGSRVIKHKCRILTHCNAGALATVDYGTALAPIRIAKEQGKELFVFVDETRPRLQGAKLTSWELTNEGIRHAIIADNASGYFMQRNEVDIVIVGADRVASNGDFANKIGTYEKAVLAKENGIPFYVAVPSSTFDFSIESGKEIPIEERDENEVLSIDGKRVAPEGASARNPAFDITPARYVTAFITENGIFKPHKLDRLHGNQ